MLMSRFTSVLKYINNYSYFLLWLTQRALKKRLTKEKSLRFKFGMIN